MLGAYCAHYYCDVCNKFAQIDDQVYSVADANRNIRSLGWVLKKNGEVRCPNHTGNETPIAEDDREGQLWQQYS
jgi:hypothetical protein